MAATTTASPATPASSLGENMLSPPESRGTNYHGITALMLACQQGQINDVQKIVRQRVSAQSHLYFHIKSSPI